jgi:cytochrome c biogenesis protein CcdA
MWAVAADALVVFHLVFIAFVLFGALVVLRWRWLAVLHVPAFLWGAWIEFFHGVCPLTPLEQRFRAAASEAPYRGGFVEHYLMPILYPAGLTPAIQLWLGLTVVVVNLALYGFVVWRWREARR